MVKFGTRLHTNKIAKWDEYYLDYDELKRLIKVVVKRLKEIKQRSVNIGGRISQLSNAAQDDDLITPRAGWPAGEIPELKNRDPALRSAAPGGPEDGRDGNGAGTIQEEPASAPTPDSAREVHSFNLDTPPPASPQPSSRMTRAYTTDETSALMAGQEGRKKQYGALNRLKPHSSSFGAEDDVGRQHDIMDASVHLELLRSENPDQIFIEKIKKEAIKLDNFYQKTFKECQKKYTSLLLRVSSLRSTKANLDIDIEEEAEMLSKETLNADSIRRTFRDIYREMYYLNNFAILNRTGLVKILKKHDKATGLRMNGPLDRYLRQNYGESFFGSDRLEHLIKGIEVDFANIFYQRDLQLARGELLLKQETIEDWEMLHIGLRLGMIFVLLLWVIWDVAIDAWIKPDEPQLPPEISRIFRGFGLFIAGLWLWSFCVYVWSTERINYIYLFDFDPRRTLRPDEMVNKASTATLVYLLLLLLYVKISRGEVYHVPPSASKYVPLALFAYMVLLLIFPTESNALLLNAILRTILAPSEKVTFYQSFVGDILTSLTKPLVDVAFTFCFFFSGDWHRLFNQDGDALSEGLTHGSCDTSFVFTRIFTPIVIAAPLIFRMLQNMRRYYDTKDRFPHLLNALKYALSNIIVLLGALHPSFNTVTHNTSWYKSLWVAAFVLSTLFTYYWDIVFDWGLLKPGYRGLRGHLMLPDRRYYYTAMVIDLVLRFSWCFTLIPQFNVLLGVSRQAYTTLMLGSIELVRRAIWSIIRVEYEHNYNELNYRRVKDVPMDFTTGIRDKTANQRSARKAVLFELTLFGSIVLFFCIIAVDTGGDN